jgi:hypothetical protein
MTGRDRDRLLRFVLALLEALPDGDIERCIDRAKDLNQILRGDYGGIEVARGMLDRLMEDVQCPPAASE